MRIRLDLTKFELEMLKHLLYSESQNPEYSEFSDLAARKVYIKLEAAVAERRLGRSK